MGRLGPYNVGSPTGDAVWSVGGEGIFLPDLTSLFTPLNRKIATAFASYDLADNVELYGELYIVERFDGASKPTRLSIWVFR